MIHSGICSVALPAVAAFAILIGPSVHAETMKWGVNAAVGSFTNLYETQENYKPVVDKIRKDTGIEVKTSPLYSSFVKTALEKESFDLLLVHTNDAAPFLKGNRYVLVALSEDNEGNRITFVAKKGSDAKALKDFPGKCVISTGSFGTAVARVTLRNAAVYDKVKSFQYVKDGDAVRFFLNNNFCDVGVTRSPKLIKTMEDEGGTVIYRADPYPVYALIASAKVDPATIVKLRSSLSTFDSQSGEQFTKSTKIKRFAPPDDKTAALLAVFD